MKRILPLLCFSVLYCIATAQQWISNSPFAGFDINAVNILEPGHLVAGGGQEANDSIQIMFVSQDYGITWIENEHDGLAPWNKSIAFSDPMNGFGAGNDGRIIQSNDGGQHWGFAVYPVNRVFNKIVNVNPLTYFIAGGKRSADSIQTIVKTVDGGANWSVIYDQPGSWLKSIFFTDTLNGMAVGDSGVILATADGGSTWTPVTPPVQRDLNGITFLNADTGFIVGGIAGRRTILRTNNAGSNWSIVMDTAGGKLNDISFADSLVGYAVGDSATVLKTTDGGLNWLPQIIDTGLTGNEEFRSVKFFDSSFGVVGGKAGVLYVYTPPLPYSSFQTQPVTSMTYSSAVLNGTVDHVTVPMNLFFEYDTSLAFANSVPASPASVNDTLPHYVSATVNSLQPFTNYYYRLKGVSGSHTYYGATLNFYPTLIPNYNTFQTSYATEVTDTSATLHGGVTNFSFGPVQFSFQYGTTDSFGREVTVGTMNINDTLFHAVSASLTGLSPDTVFYYYRLKAVAGSNVYFGNTRKLYTGLPEVPNWDFQHWQNTTVELPNTWKVIYDAPERVPGHSGDAVKLTGENIIILGAFKDNGQSQGPYFFDGIPFHYRPDSVSVYLNYNVEPGDAALLFVDLYTATDTIALKFFPLTGNSGGAFEKVSFAIPYLSSLTPDSLIMGFLTTNIGSVHNFVNNYLIIDDVSFGPGAPPVPNQDFENWFSYSYNKLLNWDYYNFFTANEPVNNPMVEQAVFSPPGDYAMELHNVTIGNEVADARLVTKALGPFHDKTMGFAIAGKHLALNGYYEYFPVNGDTLKVDVTVYKNGLLTGQGQLVESDSVSSFTPFDISIYSDTLLIPDSATIKIQPYTAPSRGLSRVVIDKLSFDGFRINVLDTFSSVTSLKEDNIKVYPNPSRNNITVEWNNSNNENGLLQLLDINGRLMKEISLPHQENPHVNLSVAELESGFYFLRIQSGIKVFNKKIVVVK